ncbi:MAG: RHS repeat protein, partial [Proteobacteria bacterium]|nr:RHS repeat protein [Pseudomonadota bacterium]
IMAHDLFGRLTTVVDDPTGPIGSMEALDPRCTKSDGLNLATRYQYDPNDNLTHQYDPNSGHVEFRFDALNRKTQHIQHKSGGALITRFTVYDEEGNLTEKRDAKNQVFTWAFDELNRQTDAYRPTTGSPFLETTHVHTEYDPNNNITRIAEAKTGPDPVTDVTTSTFDAHDRLISTTQRGLTIDYTYDNNGNRTSVSTPTSSTTYVFDNRNRILTAADAGGITTYSYFPDGKKESISYPNGTHIAFTYDPSNRISTIRNSKPVVETEISGFSYEYDKNGNNLKKISVQNGVQETTIFGYDALDRLLNFTISTPEKSEKTEY